jgi:DNA mismatch repair protein MSH4
VLFIDSDSIANLELVANVLSLKPQNSLYGEAMQEQLMIGLLDQCYTPMGSRMLRNNILQPNTSGYEWDQADETSTTFAIDWMRCKVS